MKLTNIITSQNLFQVNTAFISTQEKFFFLLGGILVLLAIVTKIAATLAANPIETKYRAKFYRLFLTIGFGELIWYLLRYENVRYFGTPFVAWLLVLWAVIWLVWLIVKTVINYGKEKQIWDKEQVKQKYLPK